MRQRAEQNGRCPGAAGLPPVNEIPVASSSQMAARSLAAPSVSPLLSWSAPWESWRKPVLTSSSREVSRAHLRYLNPMPAIWGISRTYGFFALQ